jgi:protein-S-isoprenylcysteine O-methyltransferase Ste14
MFETHAEYDNFEPEARIILERKGQQNLASLLRKPAIKDVFSVNVDHPVGYNDGPSGVSLKGLKKVAKNLTDKDKKKLWVIAEYVLRDIEENEEISPKQRKELLLGANQLIQIKDWDLKRNEPKLWRNHSQLERIAKTYTKNLQGIERVRKWDAQIRENHSMYHVDKLNNFINYSIFSIFPTVVSLVLLEDSNIISQEHTEAVYNFIEYSMVSSFFGFLMHQVALIAQDKSNTESPNTTNKLITNRHYKFFRHPLYGAKLITSMPMGLASLNPIGWFSVGKGLYHYSKACEKQDERMRILYGKEAEEYQGRTAALVPGTKQLIKGLRRILPDRIVDVLDTPVSKYLERIPFMKNEKYNIRELTKNEQGYFRGEPTVHVGSAEEQLEDDAPYITGWRAVKANGKMLCEAYIGGGKMIYEGIKYVDRKISKKLKKRARRKAYERHLIMEHEGNLQR